MPTRMSFVTNTMDTEHLHTYLLNIRNKDNTLVRHCWFFEFIDADPKNDKNINEIVLRLHEQDH